jgi:hypothetical protein
MSKTTVNLASNGQYRTTVPKDLADALELDGKKLDWRLKSGNTFEVSIVDE